MKLKHFLSWILIAAMIISGCAMAEDIADAIDIPDAVIEIEDAPVEDAAIEDPVAEADIMKDIPEAGGPGNGEVLSAEFSMPAEKLCWLIGMDMDEFLAADTNELRTAIKEALAARMSADDIEDAEEITVPTVESSTILTGRCGDDAFYTLYDDGRLVISGTGWMYSYTVSNPAPWSGKTVLDVEIENGITDIAWYGFYNCATLRSVSIADTVKTIGIYAFYNCGALKEITIPDSVTSIGIYAFFGCSSLEEITIPDSVPGIGMYAFQNCASLKRVTLSNNMQSIAKSLFESCGSLEAITIPESVTAIGENAFHGCKALKSIEIPNGVTTIETGTFQNCSALESVTIPESVTSIDANAFLNSSRFLTIVCERDSYAWAYAEDNGYYHTTPDAPVIPIETGTCGPEVEWVMYNDGRLVISGNGEMYDYTGMMETPAPWMARYQSYIRTVEIGSGVTGIGNNAFRGLSNLERVTIGDDVERIGVSAFAYSGSKKLETIEIPNSVESIGDRAFYECYYLKSILIPGSVTEFGANVFKNCDNLVIGCDPAAAARYYAEAYDIPWEAVYEVPWIVLQSESLSVSAGESALFMVAAWGSDLNYQWQYRAAAASEWVDCLEDGADTDTLTIIAGTANDGNEYRCVVSNIAGSTYSNIMKLLVLHPVEITAQPQDAEVRLNDTARFTVNATGSGLTYQWQYLPSVTSTWANTSMSGAKTNVLSVPAIATRNGYRYRCIIKDALDNIVASDAAELRIESSVSIQSGPVDCTASPGETAVFTVEATGIDLRYQWQYSTSAAGAWNNTSLSGCRTATLSVPATTTRNGYRYRCVVSDAVGSEYSSGATLTVIENTPPVIIEEPRDASVNAGETAVFSVKANDVDTYRWQYRTTQTGTWKNTALEGYATATLKVPAIASRNGYQYRCALTNSGGTVYTGAARLTVILNAPPVITVQPESVSVNVGETATFTVSATGAELMYQWQYRTSSTGAWNNTSMEGCRTAMLSVPAVASRNGYQYRCMVKNSGGTVYTNAATLTIIRNTPPVITGQPENCSAITGTTASFTVTATGTGIIYQWQYRTTATGTWKNTALEGYATATLSVPAIVTRNGYQYRCAVKNAAGTVYTNVATLNVSDGKPVIIGQPDNAIQTIGTTATFTVVATGADLTYRWQYCTSSTGTWSNTTQTGCMTDTLSVPVVATRNGYQYRCVVKNAKGSATSNAATLNVRK